ncbi:MAG TPA: tetratricopeptide repeat protein [Bacteroidota bacterium]|nr:tetratricopeptide repeat protein [Bacteroidota bacterium]
MKTRFFAAAIAVFATLIAAGCSGSKPTTTPEETFTPDRDAALGHYLNGSALDQKEDFAAAILEYQEAIQFDHDPAIYYSMAKDYAILGKTQLAEQAAKEAVKLDPANRAYHETLAEIDKREYKFDDAIAEYYAEIKADSTYKPAWFDAGQLLALTKPKEALALYQRYTDYFGADWDVDAQLVQIYGAQGNKLKAIALLKEMNAMDPGHPEVMKMLADAYLDLDSVDVALGLYKKLVAQEPANFLLRAAMAHVYLLHRDSTLAAEQIETVMTKDSLSLDQQIQFGQVFVSYLQKDSVVAPMAQQLFESIRKTSPDDWRAYWFLGAIANILHEDSVALPNFEKVTKLASWNPDGWVAVGSIYYDSEKFDRAIEVLEDAKRYLPNEFRVYFLLGVAYQRKGDDINAARTLEKAIELNDKSADAYSALGLVYDELHRHEDSDTMYERALRVDPHNHLVLNNYGYSLSERGLQLERALKMSQEAVQQQPDNQSYLDTMGWIYFQMGNYSEAERVTKHAIELGSKSPVIHEHLGDIYAKMHDKDKAMEYWQKAVQFGSTSEDLKLKIQKGGL